MAESGGSELSALASDVHGVLDVLFVVAVGVMVMHSAAVATMNE
ncbi:hypothetical protein [Bradyrhizobium lablabi]|nr:hypothetical protein [Bradyrhizobium lablabi]